jgi:hypothetical protein
MVDIRDNNCIELYWRKSTPNCFTVRGEKFFFFSHLYLIMISSEILYDQPAVPDLKYHVYHYSHIFVYLWNNMEKREENTLQP